MMTHITLCKPVNGERYNCKVCNNSHCVL